jgi:hypothetical protein
MFYAELPAVRARQVILDAAVVVWVVLWVGIGRRLDQLIERLAGPGRSLQEAGRSLSGRAGGLGKDVGSLPVVGHALRAPFAAVSAGGQSLQDAGIAEQHAMHTLAIWLGVLVAVLPILWLAGRYLPGRRRWIREATAASSIRAASSTPDLFALRALAHQPLSQLRKVRPDPMAAYREGDVDALAALELARLGLRAPMTTGWGS